MISREDLIEQSVQDFLKAALTARGYSLGGDVELVETFPYHLTGELEKNYVAVGFNFDDEGTAAELGSDLKVRQYTIQFWIFGQTKAWAKNLANVVKFAAQADDDRIPLKDYEADPDDPPVIDYLCVNASSTERQIAPDPEPWQEFVWTTTVVVQDEYHASLV